MFEIKETFIRATNVNISMHTLGLEVDLRDQGISGLGGGEAVERFMSALAAAADEIIGVMSDPQEEIEPVVKFWLVRGGEVVEGMSRHESGDQLQRFNEECSSVVGVDVEHARELLMGVLVGLVDELVSSRLGKVGSARHNLRKLIVDSYDSPASVVSRPDLYQASIGGLAGEGSAGCFSFPLLVAGA